MKYIILELIPTNISPEEGDVIQLSALKVHDFNLVDRFDVRLNYDFIKIPDLIELISYDCDLFKYVDSTVEILDLFKKWSDGYKLVMIDNIYTKDYLKSFLNDTVFIHELLDLNSSDNIILDIIAKYNLEETNYIVDLMYEALIYKIS